MKILISNLRHLNLAARLFNSYRVFYKQPNDLARAKQFMQERLQNRDSIVFLAMNSDETEAYGFAQVYPSFSSVSARKIFILNDLYVEPEYRRKGIAKNLLDAVKKQAIAESILRICLETAPDNIQAQGLYESEGYQKAPPEYLSYSLTLPDMQHNLSMNDDLSFHASRKDRKLVVITGVTAGLGREMLNRFHELGWMVAGCGRSVSEIEALAKNFKGLHSFQVVDVSDADAVQKWGQGIIQHAGLPDLIINNASIVNKNAPTWDVPGEEFKRVMDINVLGSVNVIRAFVPAMKEKNAGIIVNISSWWGRFGEKDLSPYCASKFAIEGLSQSMAKELPSNMAVVALDPGGGINTSMLQKCAPDSVQSSPNAEAWSHVAVPYIIQINTSDNGRALTCPDVVPEKKSENVSGRKLGADIWVQEEAKTANIAAKSYTDVATLK